MIHGLLRDGPATCRLATDPCGLSVLISGAEAAAAAGLLVNAPTLDRAGIGIMIADATQPDTPLVYVNLEAERVLGYDRSDLLGRNSRFLQGNDRRQPEIARMREAVAAGKPCTVVLRNYRADGSLFWNEVRMTPIPDESGAVAHVMAIIRDVTAHHDALEKLERLAKTDALTELPSRSHMIGDVDALLEAATAHDLAFAKFSIGPLEEVYNSFGSEAGDSVVRMAARRLKDLEPAGVGRIASGQFGLALRVADEASAERWIREAVRVLTAPYVLAGLSISLSVTSGFTLLRGRAIAAQELLREASIACYEAQKTGWGSIRVFDAATVAAVRGRLRLVAELRQALDEKAFELHYQPKVQLATGRIVGAEALLRWRHPVFGLQPPGRFIGAAEESGLIAEIGSWVLRDASSFAAALNRGRSADRVVSIAVNVSPIQFQRTDLLALVQAALADSGTDPAHFTVELTESVLADTSSRTRATLTALREMGCGVSIDDFGTGYSSLHYLRDLPISELKIDRSFVTKLESRPRNAAIVASVVRMANDLGLYAVAEGVETPGEREALRRLECPAAQGYFFSLPLEAADFGWLVAHHDTLPVDPGQART